MIFPRLKLENIVRADDKTRLDASGCYVSPDEAEITLVEIQPEAAGEWYDVTTDRYLDWQYSVDGEKVISVRITTNAAPTVYSFSIAVVSVVDDIILSTDSDLVALEDDILKYVRDGRATFIDKHRLARNIILDELDANRIYDVDGNRYTVADIADIEDFKKWSMYLALSIVFYSLSTQSGDFFDVKAKHYDKKVETARNRSFFRMKPDGANEEKIDSFSGELVRQ